MVKYSENISIMVQTEAQTEHLATLTQGPFLWDITNCRLNCTAMNGNIDVKRLECATRHNQWNKLLFRNLITFTSKSHYPIFQSWNKFLLMLTVWHCKLHLSVTAKAFLLLWVKRWWQSLLLTIDWLWVYTVLLIKKNPICVTEMSFNNRYSALHFSAHVFYINLTRTKTSSRETQHITITQPVLSFCWSAVSLEGVDMDLTVNLILTREVRNYKNSIKVKHLWWLGWQFDNGVLPRAFLFLVPHLTGQRLVQLWVQFRDLSHAWGPFLMPTYEVISKI